MEQANWETSSEVETTKEVGLTDMQIVLGIIEHIDKPCEVQVGNETKNIRHVYISEAKKLLESGTLTNPFAVRHLELKIKEHDPEYGTEKES